MEDRELLQLLQDLESDRVERKSSLADSKKIRQTICAFANDLPGHGLPGVLFLGVADGGACADLQISDSLLCRLADMRDDGNILPLPSMTVEKKVLDGCEVAVVLVQPSAAPPVRYQGRTFIRIGPRRGIASPEEERRLAERRRAADLPFDLRPLVSARQEDLDLTLFQREYLPSAIAPEVLQQNRRSEEEQLRGLRFLNREGVPTVLGMMVLGKDPRAYVPGFYVQFLRFEGSSLTSPIRDEKEIDGPLSQILRRLDEVLVAHNEVAVSIASGPLESRQPSYPLPALQQLTRNALLHRVYEGTHAPVRIYWFSDRIEIHSPGGPFGQVDLENFGSGVNDYRNPHLAEAMRVLGYVQRFGLGIAIAREELEKNGNPPLELEAGASSVLATLRGHAFSLARAAGNTPS